MPQRFANIAPLSVASLFPVAPEMDQITSIMSPSSSLMTPLSAQFQYSPNDYLNQNISNYSPQFTSCDYSNENNITYSPTSQFTPSELSNENAIIYSPTSQYSPTQQNSDYFNGIPVDSTPSPHASELITVHPSSRTLQAKRSTSGNNFACPVCSLTFSRKNSMRRHVLSHINLRPYTCLPCNKSFYRADIYKRHLNSSRCQRLSSQPILPYQ